MRFRPQWLSDSVETLVAELPRKAAEEADFDVVVVGSGYGGSVAAARFAGATDNTGKKLSVCVLERGREYVPGSFPARFADLPGYVRMSRYDEAGAQGRADGLFDFRVGRDLSVLIGNGLGGGSLINAGVAEPLRDEVFADGAWPQRLRDDVAGRAQGYAAARSMLRVQPFPEANSLPKYRALESLAQALGKTARPANVAVSTSDGSNPQGVEYRACNRCGDCVTGCNFRAKNTLATNYLPEARRRGAKLYTGATVSHVTREARLWHVHFESSARRKGEARQPGVIRAKHVVLAAGTLGSTEILLRSRSSNLTFSDRLGKRVSANGDTIGVLYAQNGEVNAAPPESVPHAERGVGPTITGMFVADGAGARQITVQELAVPGGLHRLFAEIVTTAALPARIARWDGSVHRRGARNDPAAVDADAIGRSQILAAFGDDGAGGELRLVRGWRDSGPDGSVKVVWKDAGKAAVFESQDQLLARGERLGGDYLRNPLWKLLPKSLADAMSGLQPDGKLVSVHPLGGCPMGEDAQRGVVDDIGRVFNPGAQPGHPWHEGLLVLDGSIIPTALGINPMLTIAALAERASARYMELHDWRPCTVYTEDLPPMPALPNPVATEPVPTAVRLAERMRGDLTIDPASNPPEARKATLEVVFGAIRDVRALLCDARHEITIERASLRLSGCAAVPVRGRVYWMERGESRPIARALNALWTWLITRGMADFFQIWREEGFRKALSKGAKIREIIKLASHVGEIRLLRYELDLQKDVVDGGTVLWPAGTHLRGVKTLRYIRGGNPWRQLSEIEMEVTPPGGTTHVAGTLDIDLMHFLRRFAVQLQVIGQQDRPSAILDLAAIALFMARILLKIHFWSFRLPEYEKFDGERLRRRLPGTLAGLEREGHSVTVSAGRRTLTLPLTRYWVDGLRDPNQTPVLLIHGFGASGAQFATDRLDENMVQHLAKQGLDVWVAELRTSIGVRHSYQQWRLDEVALEDIPAIVEYVLGTTEKKQLDVVAHCIGSAMFCSAVLKGALHDKNTDCSKIRRAVLLQVGPLIRLSTANRFRAYMTSFLRRYARINRVYASVDSRGNAADALIDRVLNTFPYRAKEPASHRLCPPWLAHTHIANCNRSSAVFGRLFEHANLDQRMLDGLGELLGHTNLRTFEQTVQYAFQERLTDYDARNAYVTEDNVRRYFGFPVRFIHGRKNDVFAPATTRRSLRLLREVHGESPMRDRVLLREYGHLDPIVGKNAHIDVYPSISGFLAKQPATAAQRQAAGQNGVRLARYLRPLLGPVLGWVRPENGSWKARVWCRIDDTRATPAFLVAAVLRDGQPVPGRTQCAAIHQVGIDQVAWLDVDLPADRGNTEIIVVGAYEPVASGGPASASKLIPANPLPDRYGSEVLEARRDWDRQRKAGASARRTCDEGYDERPDSVFVTQALLDRLASDQGMVFAVASCRYPSSVVDRERADALYGRLRDLLGEAVSAEASPALLLLVGDQIYADATAGMFDPKTRRERFSDAYREAWSAPNAREVFRQLPVLMMMDDHEVEDDWHPQDPPTQMRKWALEAFEAHQLPLGRGNAAKLCRKAGVGTPRPAYFYSFKAGGFPFFVCDTRNNRDGRTSILGAQQMAALKHWLQRREKRDGNRPKFVISPSVVAPFARDSLHSDGWDGFRDSWKELFSHIASRRISNVVFLSGDSHLSMASEIEIDGGGSGGKLRAISVVSSPLYAPYPFANATPDELVLDGGAGALGRGALLRYRVAPQSIVADDNFCTVRALRDGAGWRLEVSAWRLSGAPVVTTFHLD